jgi:hypothetical protein
MLEGKKGTGRIREKVKEDENGIGIAGGRGEMHRVKSQSSTSCLQSGTANLLTLCAYTIDAEVSKILRPLAGEGPVSPGDWQKVRVLESNENDNARR